MIDEKINVLLGGNFSNSSNFSRYVLEEGSKKYNCPKCNKKTFVLYIDTKLGSYLPEQYGRCDRESKCGHSNLPPIETLCYYVQIDSLKIISDKAVLITQKDFIQVIPKVTILEETETGLYVAEYFLNDKDNRSRTPLKISFDSSDKKYFQANNISFKAGIT
jgi:hypothetical protein